MAIWVSSSVKTYLSLLPMFERELFIFFLSVCKSSLCILYTSLPLVKFCELFSQFMTWLFILLLVATLSLIIHLSCGNLSSTFFVLFQYLITQNMLNLMYPLLMFKEHDKPLLFILIHKHLSCYYIGAFHSPGNYGMFYREEWWTQGL